MLIQISAFGLTFRHALFLFIFYFFSTEYQKKAFEVEKRINTDIQDAVKEFEAARIKSQGGSNQHWQAIHTRITQLGPELEWNEYANRSGHLIPESITMRDAAKIAFPGQNDETTKPVKVGFLERKKRCKSPISR